MASLVSVTRCDQRRPVGFDARFFAPVAFFSRLAAMANEKATFVLPQELTRLWRGPGGESSYAVIVGLRLALAAIVTWAALRSGACGMDAGPVRPGGPCTRSSDCEGVSDGTIACISGICAQLDAGSTMPEAGPPEAGGDI